MFRMEFVLFVYCKTSKRDTTKLVNISMVSEPVGGDWYWHDGEEPCLHVLGACEHPQGQGRQHHHRPPGLPPQLPPGQGTPLDEDLRVLSAEYLVTSVYFK